MEPVISLKSAETALKSSKDIGQMLGRIFKESSEIVGASTTIYCPIGVQEYTTIFKPMKAKFPVFHKELKFDGVRPKEVELKLLNGFQDRSDAIVNNDNGFTLNLGALEDEQQYQLVARYDFDKRMLNNLIDRVTPRDVPHNGSSDELEYELSAQLKYPKLLKQVYSDFNIRNIDLNVSVSVHEDVKLSIPSELTEEVEALVELSKVKGTDEKHRDYNRLVYAQQSRYGGKSVELLRGLSTFFTPPVFRKYIDVERGGGFNILKTERGKEYYTSVPFPIWPVNMNVVSETNLNLQKPAANGKLIYKRGSLVTEVKKLIGNKE